MFIAFPVVGMAGKRRDVFTVAKSTTPQTGKTAHFLGYTATEFRLTNVLEWGLNYELHFQNNGNKEKARRRKLLFDRPG